MPRSWGTLILKDVLWKRFAENGRREIVTELITTIVRSRAGWDHHFTRQDHTAESVVSTTALDHLDVAKRVDTSGGIFPYIARVPVYRKRMIISATGAEEPTIGSWIFSPTYGRMDTLLENDRSDIAHPKANRRKR